MPGEEELWRRRVARGGQRKPQRAKYSLKVGMPMDPNSRRSEPDPLMV